MSVSDVLDPAVAYGKQTFGMTVIPQAVTFS
jgi:hypothetical protein